MFELCGYETVIRGSSPFCSLDLFTPNEWLGFEYMNDVSIPALQPPFTPAAFTS